MTSGKQWVRQEHNNERTPLAIIIHALMNPRRGALSNSYSLSSTPGESIVRNLNGLRYSILKSLDQS
jgi:hypothetical protein